MTVAGKLSEDTLSRQQVQALMDAINADMADLHAAAVPLVGGLLIAQDALPNALSRWLLRRLAEHADLSYTSPAAEAALRIGLLSCNYQQPEARQELQAQFALIQALHLQAELDSATGFVNRLAGHLERHLG